MPTAQLKPQDITSLIAIFFQGMTDHVALIKYAAAGNLIEHFNSSMVNTIVG